MKHSKAHLGQAGVREIKRRIRFLQRSILQQVSQPQPQRKHLVENLYASLHKARQELRRQQQAASRRAAA